MNARTSYDSLWRKRLDALTAVWPDFLHGQTAGLHKVRVATRRIREALAIVGATASPAKVKKLNRKMRDLTRHLGPIRELDVELGMLEEQPPDNETVSPQAIAMVRREVAARRQALRRKLNDKPPVADLKKLIRKLERVAPARGKKGRGKREEGKGEKENGNSDGQHEHAWRGVLAARLLRRAKRLASALDEAGPLYAPERIHDVRIATKKLRYALEIAVEAADPHAAEFTKVLKKQQTRLGRLHDLHLLLERVREAEASPGVGSRVNDLTAYADVLERECRRLHAEFVEQRDALINCVTAVRDDLVPTLTTAQRRQARVSRPRRMLAASGRAARGSPGPPSRVALRRAGTSRARAR
jgi:CHAD domain-containing protein